MQKPAILCSHLLFCHSWSMAADFLDSSLVAGVIGAVVGGGLAAGITARVNLKLARDVRRDRASAALWEYHRALSGYAMNQYQSAGAADEVAFLAQANFSEVREAFKLAYPWAGYLRSDVREKLFHDAHFEVGFPPFEAPGDTSIADAVNELAHLLRDELIRVFPLK